MAPISSRYLVSIMLSILSSSLPSLTFSGTQGMSFLSTSVKSGFCSNGRHWSSLTICLATSGNSSQISSQLNLRLLLYFGISILYLLIISIQNASYSIVVYGNPNLNSFIWVNSYLKSTNVTR